MRVFSPQLRLELYRSCRRVELGPARHFAFIFASFFAEGPSSLSSLPRPRPLTLPPLSLVYGDSLPDDTPIDASDWTRRRWKSPRIHRRRRRARAAAIASASARDRGGLGGLPLDELDFGGEKFSGDPLGRAPGRALRRRTRRVPTGKMLR